MKIMRVAILFIVLCVLSGCGHAQATGTKLMVAGQSAQAVSTHDTPAASPSATQPTPTHTASDPVVTYPPNRGVASAKTITYSVFCKNVTPLVQPAADRMKLTAQGYPLWLLDAINQLVGPKFTGDTIGTGNSNDAASYREEVYAQIVAENDFRDITSADQLQGLQVPAACQLYRYYAQLPSPA